MVPGDYVTVYAEEDKIWYAEVVSVADDTIDVYYIKRGDSNVWSYSKDVFEISKDCVERHIARSSHSNVVAALRAVGFRPLSDSTFVRLDEIGVTPVGDPAFDMEEDDFVGIHPEMRDFIVPDEEGEAFTLARPDNDFVRETHKAVNDFNNWAPVGEAVRVKEYILGLDSQVCRQENARTRLGEGISYNHPPLR